MEQALKFIIAKADPTTAEEAIRTLAALRNNSPVVQIRYLNVLQHALASGADWTAEERQILADAVETVEPSSATRDFTLRVRLTQTERAQLQDQADQAGVDMSEYVRSRIF